MFIMNQHMPNTFSRYRFSKARNFLKKVVSCPLTHTLNSNIALNKVDFFGAISFS